MTKKFMNMHAIINFDVQIKDYNKFVCSQTITMKQFSQSYNKFCINCFIPRCFCALLVTGKALCLMVTSTSLFFRATLSTLSQTKGGHFEMRQDLEYMTSKCKWPFDWQNFSVRKIFILHNYSNLKILA